MGDMAGVLSKGRKRKIDKERKFLKMNGNTIFSSCEQKKGSALCLLCMK
jgi:hypothetical protein